MKKVLPFALMSALVLVGIHIAKNPAFAGERGAIAVAMSTASDFCRRIDESRPPANSPLACKPSGGVASSQLLAAVTCGSNQWCCKHDIGGSGACTKCCPK